jgi:7,8-dihydropterin-6-yl-methyl-4-(beta-D-ribofuranosyl)aminobenzene 5'-phosphate synthase
MVAAAITTDTSADVKLTILTDNRSSNPARFPTEHGLSILLDTGNQLVLWDTGVSDLFLRNAQTLGVNLADVDYVFLSHGHNDHVGGLGAFLDINHKAKVIVSPEAVGKDFFSTRGNLHSITTAWPLDAMDGRTILVEGNMELDDGIRIITDIPATYPLPKGNRNLMVAESRDELRPDSFRHEMACYIDGVLFTGCAHHGLENILAACPWPVKTVIGGFHLLDSKDEQVYESAEDLKSLGSRLLDHYPGTGFYTGHCTGDEAFKILKGVMGDRLKSFRAGMRILL